MIDIVPAVLPESQEELRSALARLRGISPLVQIDIVDSSILAGEESMPEWEDFDFEFDLMTQDSLQDARAAVALGASRIVVHSDFPKSAEAISMLQQTRAGDYPVLLGVAFPCTAEPLFADFESLVDFVQVMGIAEVGAQGRPFDPRALGLVEALRKENPDLFIQVDGAAAGHVRELVAAGVSRLIVGSAIVQADNPKAVYKSLYTEANAHRRES